MADLKKARDGLKELNKTIKDLLDNYDDLSYNEIRKRLAKLPEIKRRIAEQLPDVFGVPFSEWYKAFYIIDVAMVSALSETYGMWTSDSWIKDLLKKMKEAKEALEKQVKENG